MENTKTTKSLLSNPLATSGIAAAIAFVIGAIFGLVVLGWWLWPVKWVDASPADLRSDYKSMYLQMAIEAYGLTGDAQAAQARFQALGADGPKLLKTMLANPPLDVSPQTIELFAQAVGVQPGEVTAGGTPAAGGEVQLTPGAEMTPVKPTEKQSSSSLFRVVSLLCGVSLLAIILAAGLLWWRSRQGKLTASGTPAQRARVMTQTAEKTDYEAEGQEPPLAQFMTTYVHGDDLFDDSFSIDAPSGEFLGECGVGITETIGVGEPKRVMAFEVWLFDKNDIQTVTKVLMSEHAYNDEATRQRLAAKGDPVMAKPGEKIVLETAKLQLVARVVDMAYGEDALPENSYFERLTLELAVWPKDEI